MTDHMDVRKIGFTGSTGVGKTIMKSAAESNVKKVSLELGGKSPLIIFGDCDLDKAVRLVNIIYLRTSFKNVILLLLAPFFLFSRVLSLSSSIRERTV